jgi:hypothetical protein
MMAPQPGKSVDWLGPWNNLPPGLKLVNSKIKRDHCKIKSLRGRTGPTLNFGLHCLKKRGPSLRKLPVCLGLLFELRLDQGIYFVSR